MVFCSDIEILINMDNIMSYELYFKSINRLIEAFARLRKHGARFKSMDRPLASPRQH